nr:Atu4866 domain-containing protein [Saccharothrix syringae]
MTNDNTAPDADVVGMWVTADGHIRQELRADGRYDFTATGAIRDGVLHHEHLMLYRESAHGCGPVGADRPGTGPRGARPRSALQAPT